MCKDLGKVYFVPMDIIEDERIKGRFSAGLIYSVINDLADNKGYCYASNEDIANLCIKSIKTITTALSELNKYNYINISNRRGRKRIIKIPKKITIFNTKFNTK